MNTLFQHRDVHKYACYRSILAQKSLTDFYIASPDFFSEVLDNRVKRGAELLTDYFLVACSQRISKPWLNRKSANFKTLAEQKIGLVWLTGSNGRPWQTMMWGNNLHPTWRQSCDNFERFLKTLRWNSRCSEQWWFHQLLKAIDESGLEWGQVKRKEHLVGTKM